MWAINDQSPLSYSYKISAMFLEAGQAMDLSCKVVA